MNIIIQTGHIHMLSELHYRDMSKIMTWLDYHPPRKNNKPIYDILDSELMKYWWNVKCVLQDPSSQVWHRQTRINFA